MGQLPAANPEQEARRCGTWTCIFIPPLPHDCINASLIREQTFLLASMQHCAICTVLSSLTDAEVTLQMPKVSPAHNELVSHTLTYRRLMSNSTIDCVADVFPSTNLKVIVQ